MTGDSVSARDRIEALERRESRRSEGRGACLRRDRRVQHRDDLRGQRLGPGSGPQRGRAPRSSARRNGLWDCGDAAAGRWWPVAAW